MFATLRSRVILASVLWTAGMLFLMHLASVVLQHRIPMPRGHAALLPSLIGAALMAAGFIAARRSLAPLFTLRDQVVAIRKGRASEISGTFPAEVQPLIDSLNELIADRERSIQRAHAAAGDLAHCLKTPLALLAREADAARAAGNAQLADSLAEQVQKMSSQIDYQLARARVAAAGPSGTAPCGIAPCAAALVRALSTLYAARQLTFSLSIPPGAAVLVRPEDLEEILGNLLDNACKWARGQVFITVSPQPDCTELTVADDGPGLPEPLRASVLERGVRADESAPGAGLGLAIVRDLVEHYQGSITLEASATGGLLVRLKLPSG